MLFIESLENDCTELIMIFIIPNTRCIGFLGKKFKILPETLNNFEKTEMAFAI